MVAMHISKIIIRNFKCFKDDFTLEFNSGLNVLVGDNDSGKSTILEGINLTLSGMFQGRYLRNDLSEHVFNCEVVKQYLVNPKSGPPEVLIELYFGGEGIDEYKGDCNSLKDNDAAGVRLSIRLNEQYRDEYSEFVKSRVTGLPIEYYEIIVESFARKVLTVRGISLSAAFIDSTGARFQNGSDAYVSRIVRDFLEDKERVTLAKVHREMADSFRQSEEVGGINLKINQANDLLDGRELSLAVDLAARSAWESNLITCIDQIPFHFVGKGEQSLAKIAIALAHKRARNANVLLIEEPENHLSYSRLNQLIDMVSSSHDEKQIVMTTHSSFVANKANLSHLIMLHDGKTTRLSALAPATSSFFQKLAGYDTLRLLLCKRAILVEGDSDELVVQKAYKLKYGKLPIEQGTDIISVGTSFLRFLEISEKLKKPVVVVTDNDGNIEALKKKYGKYLEVDATSHIRICFDETVDARDRIAGESFNFNTLEPRMLDVNGRPAMNEILAVSFNTDEDLLSHMHSNKTECALKIFNTDKPVQFPSYIKEAIEE
jgi:putative ATP-dependent endonuclease of the OLD family